MKKDIRHASQNEVCLSLQELYAVAPICVTASHYAYSLITGLRVQYS